MNFHEALNEHFPGAMRQPDFVTRSHDTLRRFGFNADNTIACVGVCRDEITFPFIHEIQLKWGEAFNFSSLAGMLFLGRTGFLAAKHHSPLIDGRERYVYYNLPHIAIDENGEIGRYCRAGRSEVSGACGALAAFHKEMESGKLNLEYDPDDVEQSLLKHRLFGKIRYGEIPGLVKLTYLTLDVILEDLQKMIEQTIDPRQSDFAVFSGIQIHGPNKKEYIWPGAASVVVNGRQTNLGLK
jgi:hypothetical protein